jgi:hypothetical protein
MTKANKLRAELEFAIRVLPVRWIAHVNSRYDGRFILGRIAQLGNSGKPAQLERRGLVCDDCRASYPSSTIPAALSH